ncbi:unnamed protein product [Lathyrus sativus]|nr:unnamed protein product [Lathyrus sativus]
MKYNAYHYLQLCYRLLSNHKKVKYVLRARQKCKQINTKAELKLRELNHLQKQYRAVNKQERDSNLEIKFFTKNVSRACVELLLFEPADETQGIVAAEAMNHCSKYHHRLSFVVSCDFVVVFALNPPHLIVTSQLVLKW